MGTPGAPVVMVVFTDFQCPFCKDEAKMLRHNLLQRLPEASPPLLQGLPPGADPPVGQDGLHRRPLRLPAECDFVLDYHDWIYEHQATITKDNFKAKVMEWAKDKDIDVLQLSRCMETRATEADVNKNIADGAL